MESSSARVSRSPRFRAEIAEAIGTFALVFGGVGAIATNALTGALGHVGIALSFGLVILVMIYALGHISGAHFNPAITIAFAATGHFPWRRVPTYVLAQVAGATAAALLLVLLLDPPAGVGVTLPGAGISAATAFVFELIATFFLALVIIGVATDRRAAPGAAGLAIGFTVALDALFVGPLTGASMNPARSIGPAIANGLWADLLVYLAAPTVGAVLAMATYEFLRVGKVPAAGEPLGALGPFRLADEEVDAR